MAQAKHTPGPWCVEDPMGAEVGLWVVQSGLEAYQWSCIAIVTDDANGDARDAGGRFIGRTEQEANARLIAAAPELLAALKVLYEEADNFSVSGVYFSEPCMGHKGLELALAAIAKAEGA